MNLLLVLPCLLPAAFAAPDTFVERLRTIDPRDAAALLALGAWCEDRKQPEWAANVYARIGALGPQANKELYCEGLFRLARIEIARGQHDAAYARLRELALQHGHGESRALLESLEGEWTRKQMQHILEGDRSLEAGALEKALTSYEKAHALLASKPADTAFVPPEVLLTRVAAIRDRLDKAYYEKKYKPQLETRRCKCSGSKAPGFVDCGECGGDGEVSQQYISTKGVKETKDVPCPGPCKGNGYLRCGTCFGLGHVAKDWGQLRSAFIKVAERASGPKCLDASLAGALAEVEEILLSVKQGGVLNYFRAMEPEYPRCQDLREAAGALPPGSDARPKAEKKWAALGDDLRLKISFLLNYACEYADYIQRFDMLRKSVKLDFAAKSLRAPWSGPVWSAAHLSAFPEQTTGGWMAVTGVMSDYAVAAEEHKGYITLSVPSRGEAEQHLRCFVWLPSAETHLRHLEKGLWRKQLGGLTDHYPFGIAKEVGGAPRDHVVVLVGRFLRNGEDYPPNWFEVWRCEVGLSRTQAEIHRMLSRPLDIAFPEMPAAAVARILKDFFDLDIRFEGIPSDTVIAATAKRCDVGLFLSSVARDALNVDWYCDGSKIVFCASAPSPLARDLRAVLEKLQQERPPEAAAEARRGSRSADGPQAPDVVGDPAGLRLLLRRAVLAMRYEEAERCLKGLSPPEGADGVSTAEKRSFQRLAHKLRLCRRLTERTPVSHLVTAPGLVQISYRTPAGESREKVVIVHKRSPEEWRIQEAFGAIINVSARELRSAQEIPAVEWRQARLLELEARAREAEAAKSPAAMAAKLFVLALFAKTHGFSEQGVELLEQAIGLPAFESVLRTLFQEESEWIEDWKWATGQASAPDAAVPAQGAEPGAADEAAGQTSVELLPVEPLPGDSDPDALLIYARTYLGRGNKYLREVLKGENASVWRKHALESYSQAEKAIQRHLELRPQSSEATALRRELLQWKSDVLKDLGFFD